MLRMLQQFIIVGIGATLVPAAIFADLLQVSHPYNLSSWLLDFGLSGTLVISIVWCFYLLIPIAASLLIKKLIRSAI